MKIDITSPPPMNNSWKKLFLSFFCFLSSQLLSAQEICTNGIDDDGDGFIDCYDSQCSGGPSCTDFYFGNSVLCAEEPTANPTFSIRTEWASADETANSHATPTVGDINQDGTPEVVVTNRQARTATVLDGVTGATEFQINLGFEPENGLVLANLQGDGCAEMIFVENLGNEIEVYDCTGTLVWSGTSTRNNIGLPSVADFDGDGNAELYYKNEIRDALTGTILVTGSGNWDRDYVHGPIAIDIVGDSRLELITGDNIWDVDLTTGTLTSIRDMDTDLASSGYTGSYHPKYYSSWDDQWSAISVADFNLDGNIDVLTSGALGNNYNGRTSIFFWDVANGNVEVYQDVNFARGTGRINIADVDGDGFPNATFIMDQILYSLELDGVTGNLVETWKIGVKEGSSGFTGCSLFDFDGDGAFETVYRSEQALLIIDGKTQTVRQSLPCISRTQEEYPIVADIDGDGASEICVTCYTSDATPFNPYENTQYAHVRVFGADGGEVWQPSRSVWNQHGYFNVNVNDDLTIPISQQNHAQIFSTDVCTVGPNRVLNTFLNQSPFVDEDGCPSYVSPDIDLAGNANITPTNSTCPNTEFEVSFQITNTGDAIINGLLPVSFYAGDPEIASSTYLNTQTHQLNNFRIDSTETITMTVEGIGGDFELFIVVNNNGQQPPIILNSAGLPECDFGNNVASGLVTYDVFPLTVNKLSDNEKCDPTKTNNGTAEAYFEGASGGDFENIWFEDFDALANGTKNDNSGDSQWGTTPSGTPSFFGVNQRSGNKGFRVWNTGGQNEVNTLTWTSETIDISGHTDVDISVDMFADGPMEASGVWRDVMRVYYKLDGGANVLMQQGLGNFGYNVASASGLNGSTLEIIATFHSTADDERFTIDNIDISGTSALVNKKWTDADGFEFYWYPDGNFSTLLHTGSVYSTMAAGTYSVVGYAPMSNCYSDTASITINAATPTYFVEVYEVSPLTDCSNPNGVLSAFAYTNAIAGVPQDTLTEADGVSFEWVIASEGITVIGTGDTLGGLEALEYRVSMEHIPSGCTNSAQENVTTSFITPDPSDIDIVYNHVSTCNGTGSLAASVNGVTAGYDFDWYIGSGPGTSPDYTTATISGITPGFYTVRVVDQASQCSSEELIVELLDNSIKPNPTAYEVTPNSSCDSFNGEVSADGDGAGTIAGYDFTWYSGSPVSNNELPGAIAGSVVSADGATASNLPSGLYTVIVETGGCSDTTTVDLTDSFTEPAFTGFVPVDTEESIDLQSTGYVQLPQLFGSGNPITNGVTISYWVDLDVNNFNNDERIFSSGSTGENQVLLWSDNHNGLAFVVRTSSGGRGRINSGYSATGWAQITGTWDGTTGDMYLYVNGVQIGYDNHIGSGVLVNTGNPMYVGRDNGNINSKKFTGEVDEVRFYNYALSQPEIVAQMCGELTGSETGLVAYYDFNNIPSTASGTSVPDGAGNGHTGTLRNGGANISFPTADITCPDLGVTNNSSCDPGNPNGAIDLAGLVSPAGSYTYTLYDGFSTATQLAQNATGLFTGLDEGFYTVTAQDPTTLCITVPATLSVGTIEDLPAIVTSTVDDMGCNSVGTGEIEVTSSSNSGEPSAYTYQLFDGASFTTQIGSDVSVADGSVGHTFTGLEDGVYRIRVTNDDLTCESYVDVILDDISTTPTFQSISKFNNTNCGALSNGLITTQMAGGNSNYTFRWYEGSTTSAPLLVDSVSNEIRGLTASGASSGTYTVVAVNNVTGCETAPQTRTITDNPIYPDVTVYQVQAQTGCGPGGADGIADAFVTTTITGTDSLREESNYSFEWFDASMTPIDATSLTASGLQAGVVYTVTVTDNSTGCSTDETITISQNPIRPVITAFTPTANTSCDPLSPVGPTGAAVVTVEWNGSTITNPSANGYTFTWYEGNGTGGQNITSSGTTNGVAATGEDTESISTVIDSTYTVVVTSPNGCVSDPFTLDIPFSPTLPDITVVEVDDNNVCDVTKDPTGEVVVTPTTGVVADYDFQWYFGTGTGGSNLASQSSVLDGPNEAILSTLSQGDYTLEMTTLATGCTQQFFFEIDSIPAQPIVLEAQSEINNNTICVGSSGNGSVIAALDLDNIEVNGRENDEVWQLVSTCNTQVLDDATPVGTNGFQLTTETNNQFGRIWLGDTLDLSDPLRLDFRILLGSKDASGADGIAFTMHRDPRGYDARGNVGGDLGVGETQNTPGPDQKVEPAITIEFDTYQNGGIGDPTYDHTNLFFNGNIETSALGAGMGNNLPTIEQGQTNSEDGDTLRVSIIIIEDPITPGQQQIELWVEESLRWQYNGDVINNVFGGNTDVIAGFTSSTGGSNNNQAIFLDPYFGEFDFNWTDSNGNPIGGNDPFICGVRGGDYTLEVISNSTGCISDVVTFEVADDLVDIDASIVIDQLPTFCTTGTPDGALSAAQGTDDGGNYSYQWYDGSGNEITQDSTQVTLTGLEPGDYSLLITDIEDPNSSCFATADISLATFKPVVVITGTETDATNCDALDNGSYVINTLTEDGSGGNPADYVYDLYDNLGNLLRTGEPTTIAGLTVGNYSVVPRDAATGCEFDAQPFEIEDASVTPILSLTTTPNSDCGATGDNGSVSLTIDNDDGGTYLIEWFNGSDLNDESSPFVGTGTGTATISELAAGDYWVKVTDSQDPSNTCFSRATETVSLDPLIMNVTASNITDSDQCSPSENGSIEITTVSIDGTPTNAETMTAYTFEVLDNTQAYVKDFENQADGVNEPTATDLAPGSYHVRVVEDASGCTSAVYPFDVDDISVTPTLSLSQTPSTICAGGANPDGTALVTITNDDGNAYTYLWHTGTDTSTPINTGTNPSAATANLTGVSAGFYTVLVTDNQTTGLGCFDSETIEITRTPPTFAVTATTVDATNCSLLDNGSYTITAVTYNGVPYTDGVDPEFDDFRFTFYNSAAAVIQAESATPSLTALTPANYSVRVRYTTSNCTSASFPISIADASVTPIISLASTPNTDCGVLGDNGSLTVTVDNPDAGTYSYEWFLGDDINDDSSPFAGTGAGTATISDLAAGDYWVRVTDTSDPSSTCFVRATEEVTYDPPVITVNTVAVTHQEDCAPVDGVISITDIIDDGATISAGGLAAYTFTLYSDLIGTVNTPDFTGTSVTGLSAGTYYVSATNAGGCESALRPVTVLDNRPNPTITPSSADNTVCAGTPTGQASVAIAGTYTYDWYLGSQGDTSTPLVNSTDPGNGSDPTGVGTNTVDGLVGDTYWIRITDNDGSDGGIGCFYDEEITVNEDQAVVAITTDGGATPNSVCDPSLATGGTYNGAITITGITLDAVGDAIGNYEFQWYNSGGTIIQPFAASATYNEFEDGNYTVIARNTTTLCVSDPYPITIGDATSNPVIAGNFTITNSQSCDNTSFPNGSIDVDPDGNTASSPAGYTISWYTGGTSTISGGTQIGGASSDLLDDIVPGVYSVRVIEDATGCRRDFQFTVGSDPVVDPILITGQAQAVTDCAPNNGSAFASTYFIDYAGASGAFTVGNTLTGATSTETATILDDDGTTLTLGLVSGDFEVAEVIDDGVENATVATITGSPSSDFTWEWLEADKTTPVAGATYPGGAGVDESLIEALGEGIYFAAVQNSETGCLSDTVQVEILRDPSTTFAISEDILTPPSACSGALGEFRLEITDGGAGATAVDVVFEDDFGNTLAVNGVPLRPGGGDFEITVADLDPGDGSFFVDHDAGVNGSIDFINGGYSIEVTDASGTHGCVDEYSFFLPFQNAPRIDLVVANITEHSLNCQPYEGAAVVSGDNTNGTTGGQGGATGTLDITLTLIDAEATGDSQDSYQLFLYQGTSPLPNPDMDLIIEVEPGDGALFSDLDIVTANGTSTGQIRTGGIAGDILTINFQSGDIADFYAGSITAPFATNIVSVVENGLWSVSSGRPTDLQVVEGESGGTENVGNLGYGLTTAGNDDSEKTYTFSGLAAGEYTIMAATEGITFCLSPSITIEIEDRFNELDIDRNDPAYLTIAGDQNCAGASINSTGSITISQIDRVHDDGAGGTLVDGTDDATTGVDYTYEWFAGDDVSDPDLLTAIPTANISANGNAASILPAGFYTVRITNTTDVVGSADNCQVVYTYEVPEDPDVMVFTATPTDNTNCTSPYNGIITINDIDINSGGPNPWNGTAGYTAELFESGNTTPIAGPIASGGVTNQFTDLNSGDYVIVVTNDLTCESGGLDVTVDDGTTDPVLNLISADDNPSCNGEGLIEVEVIGDAADYNFEWLVGDITSTTNFDGTYGTELAPTSGIDQITSIDNIEGGTYTLRVTDINDVNQGCVSFITVTIEDDVDLITSFDFSVEPNDACTPNGSITINQVITQNFATTPTTLTTYTNVSAPRTIDETFTITVYESDQVTIANGGSAVDVDNNGDGNDSIGSLSPGIYYVQIELTDDGSGSGNDCVSTLRQFTVGNSTVTPDISVIADAANTICDPGFGGGITPTGQLTATVDNVDGETYDFQWYLGDLGDTSTPLSDGFDPGNGSDPTGSTGTITSGNSTTTISGLYHGTYWVEITDTEGATTAGLSCVGSAEFDVSPSLNTINARPGTEITSTPLTNCDLPANGSIIVNDALINTIGGNDIVADFTVEFFNSALGSLGNGAPIAGDVVLENLSVGTYYVQVTENATGCASALKQISVVQDITEPEFTPTVTASTFCVGDNGTVTIDMTTPPDTDEGDYTFDWYQGIGTSDPFELAEGSPGDGPIAGVTGSGNGGGDEATGLAPGFYTIIITATTAADGIGCSDQLTVEVEDDPDLISIPAAGVNITNVDNCTPANGQLEVDQIILNGSTLSTTTDLANYQIELWNSTNTALIENFDNQGVAGVSFPITDADLAAGTYFIRARDLTTGCLSPGRKAIVVDNSVNPIISIVENAQNTICDPGYGGGLTPTGQLTATIDNVDGQTYSFQWYLGSLGDTSTPLSDGTDPGNGSDPTGSTGTITVGNSTTTISGLYHDTYWVQITDTEGAITIGLACIGSAELEVTEDLNVINARSGVEITTTPLTNCDVPSNGSIIVNDALINTVGGNNIVADFTVEFFNSSLASLGAGVINGATRELTGLGVGTYYVQVTEAATGCASALKQVQVIQDITEPEYTTTITSDTGCDPAGGNGSIIIDMVNPPDTDEADYTFDWYQGIGTSNPFTIAEGSPGNGPTAGLNGSGTGGGDEATGLNAGFYTILITAVTADDGIGCSDQVVVEVLNNPNSISIPSFGIDTTVPSTNCSPGNGQIIVDGLRVTQGGTGTITDITTFAGLENFELELFEADGTTSLGLFPTQASLAGSTYAETNADLEPGTYVIRARSLITNCVSAGRNVVITNNAVKPTATITSNLANTACDVTAADGSLELTITGPDADANYDVEWYVGNFNGLIPPANEELTDATLAAGGYTPSITTAGSAPTRISTLSNVAAGQYFAVIYDTSDPNNNCTRTIVRSIVKDSTYNIDLDLTVISNQTECTPNGEVEVSDVELTRLNVTSNTSGIGGVAPVLAVYDLELLDENLASLGAIASDADLQGLAAGNYFLRATNQTSQCVSSPTPFTINENIIYPTANQVVTQNTDCGGANGSIELTLLTGGVDNSPYTVDWRVGQNATSPVFVDPTNGTETVAGNVFTISGLAAGFYTANVTDGTSGCVRTFTYEIVDDFSYPTINIPDAQITANTTCIVPGNGEIQLDANDIVVDGVTQTDLANFTWTITAAGGSTISGNASPFSPALAGASTTFTGLSPDTYTIMATTLAGCATSIDVEILDESVRPIIDSLNMIPNSNCIGGSNALGSVEILSINGNPAGNGDYTFSWTDGGGNPVAGNEILANVVEDTYTVMVTETATNCTYTQLVDVTNEPELPFITSYEVNDNTFCSVPGNGSFSLVGVRYLGVDYDVFTSADSTEIDTNYELEVFDASNTLVIDGDTNTPFDIDSLSGGDYTARLRRLDSECSSALIAFTIDDVPTIPRLQIVQVEADSTCSVAGTPNGILRVITDNQTNPMGYSFSWTDAGGSAIGTDNDSLINVAAGIYSVEVTELVTGCSSTASFTLENIPAEPEILSFVKSNVNDCTPSDGMIEITQVSIGLLTDYRFDFYNTDPTVGSPAPVQSSMNPVLSTATLGSDMLPGTYYVIGFNTVNGCETPPIVVQVIDNTTPPAITMVRFRENQNCDPALANGLIEVAADGSQDGTLYDFEWRDSGGNIVQPDSIAAVGLAADTYTVTVTDLTTGCVNTRSFVLDEDPLSPIPLFVSVGGNTNCVNPNGTASVSINVFQQELIDRGKALSDFNFHWFAGRQVYDDYQNGTTPNIANADFTGSLYTGLTGGQYYSVFVTDNSDAFCSGSALAFVPDDVKLPDFRIDIINNVTICYPNLPDGRATIGYSDKPLSQYQFDWYAGTDTTTTPIANSNSVTNITSVDSLNIGVYTVVARDVNTGCIGIRQFNMMDGTMPPNTPSLTIVSNRTNCLIPNGAAVARVDGQTIGYEFEWYEESDPNTLFNTGSQVNNLDTTTYLVKAINTRTGCESAFGRVTITNAIVDPVFTVEVTNSLCVRDESGSGIQHSGSAVVVFDGITEIDSIVWYDPDGNIALAAGSGQRLIEAQPGDWSVWFRSINGCDYTKDFRISTQLSIYNGVSANDDTFNEFFRVDCIEFFDQNRVSVYNRDGSLVWEIEGYSNFEEGKRFVGLSNVGRQDLKLPTGTYFYFIDKGDGSDVIHGYLELVR